MAPQSDDEFGLDSSDEAELLASQEPNVQTNGDSSSVSSLVTRIQDVTRKSPNVDQDPQARSSLLLLTRELTASLQKPVTIGLAQPAKRKGEDGMASPAKRQRSEERTSPALQVATDVLNSRFGLDAFRLKQAGAVTRLLDGGSCVVVFPTGGGKSLCYQVPALAFKLMDRMAGVRQGTAEQGITLIVSPLIALMKDQVDALKRRGISAAALDSTKSKDEYLAIVDSMRNGQLDILYCAPERLNNEGFVASMAHVRGGVRLLAVDEAHCISEWGHAFRPDYLKVARFAKEIQAERVVCLTATATPKVAEDVRKAFDIPEDGLFRTATYRPNLRLQAMSFQTKKESFPHLVSLLKGHPGPSIIYVTLQRHTEELAGDLQRSGFRARHFHAGMVATEKAVTQDMFMTSKDLIIVATIAFGMGIDKADIRNVVHYDVPRSLEGYSQEIGRAGRDGKESHCMLYLCAEDLHLRESFARGDLPSKTSVTSVLNEIFSTKPTETGRGMGLEANLLQQSKADDIKVTVLKNIYAQLELRFHLLRETTPKFTKYTYELLAKGRIASDTSAAGKAVRGAAKLAAKYHTVDIDKATRSAGLARTDIVSKLNDWHDNAMIDLKPSGVVNIYRIMRGFPPSAAEQRTIIDELYAELEAREQQDLDRMEQVNGLVTGEACFARTLAEHFGDTLPDGVQECGACSWCETHKALQLVKPPTPVFDQQRFQRVLKGVPDRDDARYLARIAFGIGSPRVTAAKLSQSPIFGSMDDHDFTTLLKAFTKACEEDDDD